MIRATSDDKLKWAFAIANTRDAATMLQVIDRIWTDGYQSGEVDATMKEGRDGKSQKS